MIGGRIEALEVILVNSSILQVMTCRGSTWHTLLIKGVDRKYDRPEIESKLALGSPLGS